MGVDGMNDFFEEYGWFLTSMVGGSLGIELLFRHLLYQSSALSEFLRVMIGGLM